MCAQRWNLQRLPHISLRTTCLSASVQGLPCWRLWLSEVAFLSFTSQLFQQLYTPLPLVLIPGMHRVASGLLGEPCLIHCALQKSRTLHEAANIWQFLFVVSYRIIVCWSWKRSLRSRSPMAPQNLDFINKILKVRGTNMVFAIFILLRVLWCFSSYLSQAFLKERAFNIPFQPQRP